MLAAINWSAVGVIIGAVLTVVGGGLGLLGRRLDKQDVKIDDNGRIIADTRVSVARIEGYMARQNGHDGQRGRTPDLLPDLPAAVVVPSASAIVVDS